MKCTHLAFCSRSQRARATPTRPPAPNSAREREGGSTPEAASEQARAADAGGRPTLLSPPPPSFPPSLAYATTRPKISLTATAARRGDPRFPMASQVERPGCVGSVSKHEHHRWRHLPQRTVAFVFGAPFRWAATLAGRALRASPWRPRLPRLLPPPFCVHYAHYFPFPPLLSSVRGNAAGRA